MKKPRLPDCDACPVHYPPPQRPRRVATFTGKPEGDDPINLCVPCTLTHVQLMNRGDAVKVRFRRIVLAA